MRPVWSHVQRELYGNKSLCVASPCRYRELNSPMAGIMFTVFKLAVAWRMFSGNSSPLKAREQRQHWANKVLKRCTGASLGILTHRLSAPTLPSVGVWWGPAGTESLEWGCSGSPQCKGSPGKKYRIQLKMGSTLKCSYFDNRFSFLQKQVMFFFSQ